MIDYRGPLDDRHLHAVARAALRGHGFRVTRDAIERHLGRQMAIGRWLRDDELATSLPLFVDLADYRANAQLDSYLWERVAVAAGFGYRMSEELALLRPTAADRAIHVLSGAFNAAITVLDYVVDEVPGGRALLQAMNERAIAVIFTSETGASALLRDVYRSQTSGPGRLALALVSASALGFWRLHRRRRAPAEWEALHRAIAQLRDVQARVTSPAAPTTATASDLEAKSALSVTVISRLSALGADGAIPPMLTEATVALGRLLYLTDDMADLRVDLSRRSMSTATMRVGRIAADRGSMWLADSDIYDYLDSAAAEIMSVLESPSLLQVTAAPIASSARPRTLASDTDGSTSLPDFARNTVADWLSWNFEELRRPEQPDLTGDRLTAATGAIQVLLADQREGYREATHHLRFPRQSDHGIGYESHPAVLYQRSLILDVLAEAYGAGLPVPREILDSEAVTVLQLKHRDLRGGWAYIPAVRELPPDADDLGMVLRALVRVGGRSLATACDEPVRLALDSALPSGGFPTWIIDPRGTSSVDLEAAAYLGIIGGLGVHPDVVATLLHALVAYDPARFRSSLVAGGKYLEGAQDASGAWTSKWYAGPYYATYHAVSVLRAVAPGSSSLSRAGRFLLETQMPSGAWGSGNGTSMATSIAVATLAAFGPDYQGAADRGTRWLIRDQLPDGGWPSAPFIEFATRDGIESYSSSVVSTALCLRAILSSARAPIAERPYPQSAGNLA